MINGVVPAHREKIGLLFSTDSLHLKYKVINCFNFDPHGASPFLSIAGRVKVTGTIWKAECVQL